MKCTVASSVWKPRLITFQSSLPTMYCNKSNYIDGCRLSLFFQYIWGSCFHIVLKLYQARIHAGAHPVGTPPPPLKMKTKGLAWLHWQSIDVKYVILTLCSFDSSLHCNEYSYMSLLPRSGSCKNRHRLHFTFCNHGCWVWWTTSKMSKSSKAAWFFLQ